MQWGLQQLASVSRICACLWCKIRVLHSGFLCVSTLICWLSYLFRKALLSQGIPYSFRATKVLKWHPVTIYFSYIPWEVRNWEGLMRPSDWWLTDFRERDGALPLSTMVQSTISWNGWAWRGLIQGHHLMEMRMFGQSVASQLRNSFLPCSRNCSYVHIFFI